MPTGCRCDSRTATFCDVTGAARPYNHSVQPDPKLETYAAVDLGSNSFHMLVARREHGELRVLDRIREMVRLGGGLDASGNLDTDTRQRALECLARFGQRLRGIPAENVRCVGTQTFRRLHDAIEFLHASEQALGRPVDIIAGREEARLVYLGVTQWVSGEQQKQLVMDIGGGSTELVIGEGYDPLELESLQFGCVSVTNRFFADGRINPERWHQARRAVLAELQDIRTTYRQRGWQTAVGSSGTIRSVAAICQAHGWCETRVTRQALHKLQSAVLSFTHTDEISIEGLSERRAPVFIGGLAILMACFEALALDELLVSPYALREGLLHDLLGRLEHRDPRAKAVEALMTRFAVDLLQVERVKRAALGLFDQVSGTLGNAAAVRGILGWAADLHEIGLALSHPGYQQHSAYLVEASDLAGFTRQEQLFLAALVGHQRRDIPADFAARLPARLFNPLCAALVCMRLAWIFSRTREDGAIPAAGIRLEGRRACLFLAQDWIEDHPLTIADLEYEQQALQAVGLHLDIQYTGHEPA
jgi:exopolyphosphatase/guanosine-5'-triphosphate,3'-diphosphate pyrophosphatase